MPQGRVVILGSWHDADKIATTGRRSVPAFFGMILLLEAGMVGVFAATDLFLFYVFFELILIPMYFLIGSFGGPQRQYAAVKFLLYSLFGGLIMLGRGDRPVRVVHPAVPLGHVRLHGAARI